MKRLTILISGAVAVFLAGVAVLVVAWIVATPQGARWLLTSLTPFLGGTVSVQKIEGRIIDHLLLTKVQVTLKKRSLELESLELRWKPLLLMMGTIAVQELSLNSVRIQDDTPTDNKPLSLTWPRDSGSLKLFDGRIAQLRVMDLTYRRFQRKPFRATSISGSVSWQDSLLSINNIKGVSPSGRISGSVSAGLDKPSLTTDLVIIPAQPLAGVEEFLFQVRQSSAIGSEQLAWVISIFGSSGKRKLLELGGGVGLAQNALNLRRFHFTRPGRKGVITADGSLAFTAKEPLLTLEVRLAGIDVTPELNIQTDLSGTLRLEGTLESYQGGFELANNSQGWESATVSALFQGSSRGMKLAPLTVRVIDGTLSGNLDIDWRNGFAMEGAISGRNLNLARIEPGLKGVTNFSATGKVASTMDGPVIGRISGTLLESRLHGQAVTGELQADFIGSNLSIARLALQGRGFELHASGRLNQRLSLTAEITDLSMIVPGADGKLHSDGWVCRRDGHLSGSLTGRGRKLVYAGLQIEAANLSAVLDQGNGFPLHIAASFEGVVYDRYALNELTVGADVKLLPENRFELVGSTDFSGGQLHQKKADGDLNLTFPSSKLIWNWQGETLASRLSINAGEQNQLQADFKLPIPARFPVEVHPKGAVQGSLNGHLQEIGIIAALFPEYFRESFGEVDAEISVRGSWEGPDIEGKLQLVNGGAYLPAAGIHFTEVQILARLEKNLIRIYSFRAVSGPGQIKGKGLLTLDGLKLSSYQGTMQGENFQTVYFPELRIQSSPDFDFEGTTQKLKLRGKLGLPELNFIGTTPRNGIAPSKDVVLEGKAVPAPKKIPLDLDVQVRVTLGDRVSVKVEGVDALLGGGMDLSLTSLDRITSRGEIRVVKGLYRSYGVNLEIVRGRLFFSGGPINSPTLDILALRTIGDIRAGVTVTGTLLNPVTRLYSVPVMPDIDVLAYIVLGHPLGSNGEQASLVAQAAGALLTSSQALVLQDEIKKQLGLSTLEIQGGVGGTVSHMGYRPLQVTPPGSIPADQQPGMTETMLSVGKYLTPQLYISYGKSLFTGSNQFRIRYDIFKQWQIETLTGSESGADLYYKMEFK